MWICAVPKTRDFSKLLRLLFATPRPHLRDPRVGNHCTRDCVHYVNVVNMPQPKLPMCKKLVFFVFFRTIKKEINLQCTDGDNRSYQKVCKMSFISFSLAVIFVIRLFSTSFFRVPKQKKVKSKIINNMPNTWFEHLAIPVLTRYSFSVAIAALLYLLLLLLSYPVAGNICPAKMA